MFMNKKGIHALYVHIKQQDRAILNNIKSLFMKVSSIHAQFVDMKHHSKMLLFYIFNHGIKYNCNIVKLLGLEKVWITSLMNLVCGYEAELHATLHAIHNVM